MRLKRVRKMRLNNLIFVMFIVILFFVSSCVKNQQNQSQSEDLEFKKMCTDAGYEWMYMKPTQDGKFIKDAKECWGCMVEGIEHVCDKEKFSEFAPSK
jgi:hypothetical protein